MLHDPVQDGVRAQVGVDPQVPLVGLDLLPHRELAVALAEAVVGHEGLAPRPLLVVVLPVQPLERDPDPGELAVHALPVGVRVDVPVADLLGEERGVDCF